MGRIRLLGGLHNQMNMIPQNGEMNGGKTLAPGCADGRSQAPKNVLSTKARQAGGELQGDMGWVAPVTGRAPEMGLATREIRATGAGSATSMRELEANLHLAWAF